MAESFTFSESGARRIVNTVRRVEAIPDSKSGGRSVPNNPIPDDKFLAKITGNAALGGGTYYRWKYAWTEVLRDGDGYATRTGGRSGTTSSGYALNISEMGHTSTYAWCVDVTGTDYDATTSFAPRPIGGGGTADTHRYDNVVEMTQTVDVNGNTVFHFERMGGHDGAC